MSFDESRRFVYREHATFDGGRMLEEPTTDVTVHIPETPPPPVVVESPATPVVVETNPDPMHTEIGRLVEWRQSMDEWRNEKDTQWTQLTESTQATQETLSGLSSNVQEMMETVRNQSTPREVILPLPVSETQEQEPDNPDDGGTNPTMNTANVPVLNPVNNDNPQRERKPKVLHRRRNGQPNT